jgi:hypothetical protein
MDSGVRFVQQEQLPKRSPQMVGGEGTEEKRGKRQRLLCKDEYKDIM